MGAQPDATGAAHRWKFFRAGGVDQVALERNSDLASLAQLDQKLWVVLSCPTRGLELDAKTLDLIDADHDGRVRAPEVVAAVQWVVSVLKDPMEIARGADALPLSSVYSDALEGRQLLASARQILASLGKPDAAAITLADTADTAAIFSRTRFNGDGVIPPGSVDDETAKSVIADIIACLGGEMDRSGAPGVTQAKVDGFFAELQSYSDWWKKAEDDRAAILPLGEAMASAYDALRAVRPKVDDYFTRCRLAAFDSAAAAALNPAESEFQALAAKGLSASSPEVAAFPLARIESGRPLPLSAGVNPAWAAALAKFRRDVAVPIAGLTEDRLEPGDWERINARFAPYETWLASKAGSTVEKLGLARIREILAGNSRSVITAAIAQDKALEAEMNQIIAVDRLVRYYRDLYQLLCNFVSFRDFYSGRRKAIFQAGTLYLDGRSCDLCLKVDDPARHDALSALSQTYLAYCDCARKGAADKMLIAAAFTAGDSDHLRVGRNGIFYDRQGGDWDATITKIVEHPISIWQAVVSPYKRIARIISDQLAKAAAARDQAAQQKAAAAAAAAAAGPGQPPPPPAAPPQPYDIGKTAGILAAVGLALGFISAAAASIFLKFTELKPLWKMPLVILAIPVVISGASVFLAALKLRQRNLGPILDANGWAVNGRVKINIPFGGALTKTARLPKGSARLLRDPYAVTSRKAKVVFWIILLALVVALTAYFILLRKGILDWPFAKPAATDTPLQKQMQGDGTSAPAK